MLTSSSHGGASVGTEAVPLTSRYYLEEYITVQIHYKN
jgi:hypothetical protein